MNPLVKKIIESKEYQEARKELLSYDENKVYIHCNEMQGVDYYVEFDPESLDIDFGVEDIESLMDDVIEQEDEINFWDNENKNIVSSTGDEAFINDQNVLLFHDLGGLTREVEYVDDFHLWLEFESIVNECGYFPGLFYIGYYGDCTPHKFDEDYRELLAKGTGLSERDLIRKYILFYAAKKELNDTTMYLDNLPTMIDELPFESEDDPAFIEVIEIDIEPKEVTLEVELESGERVSYKIKLEKNSIGFMTEEEECSA